MGLWVATLVVPGLSGSTVVTLHVEDFSRSAVLGALVVSLVSRALALLVPEPG